MWGVDRTKLDRVPARYPLWVAALSVLIFMAPNLLVVAADGLEALESSTETSPGQVAFGLVFTMILQLVVFGLSLLPLLAAGRPFRRLLGPTRPSMFMVALGLGVGVVTVVLTYMVNIALVLAFDGADDPVEQGLMETVLSGGFATFLAIVIAVVLAPITEEVVFRGVLHRALADRAGVLVGAVVSSAIFAVIHIEVLVSQPLGLGGLFVVGLVLAYAYHYTGSLLVPILGHAVFNGVSITLAFTVDRILPTPAWSIPLVGG
jgi:uncharacterized protein